MAGLVCATAIVHAQSPSEIRPLHIGDMVPDIKLNHIINYKTATTKLSAFRGKLLILDFWATWCSPCVAMIPQMYKLQNSFKEEIQFLPIAYQDSKTVQSFLDKIQKELQIKEPSVTGDKILSKLFPHNVLPHYVWIGKNGKVQAITGPEEVNAKNIKRMLTDLSDSHLQLKQDVGWHYDGNEPILIGDNSNPNTRLIYHSVLTGYNNKFPSIIKISSPKDSLCKITMLNVPLIWLYRIAYSSGKENILMNRVRFEVRDTSRFINNATGNAYKKWIENYGFCYELIVPAAISQERYSVMQEDMERLFPQVKATYEPEHRQCLVLVRTSGIDNMHTSGGKPSADFEAFGCHIRNKSLALFFSQLQVKFMQKSSLPLINETNYHKKVDMDIDAKLSDLASVNKALEKYHLKFIKAYRNINILVIGDEK